MRSSALVMAAAILLTLSGAAGAALPPAPVAKKIPVTDTYFGVPVVDPYRWMETNGPDLHAYLKAQGERTRSVLDGLPGRAPLEKRLRQLADTNAGASYVMSRHGLTFFERTPPGANSMKLYVRSGNEERLLVDPDTMPGPREAIAYYMPSNDGRHVAVGLAAGGSENASVRVVDVAHGTMLSDVCDLAEYGVTSWSDDGTAFYYFKRQPVGAHSAAITKYMNVRAYRHVVGSPGASDTAVFGSGVARRIPIAPTTIAGVVVAPQSPYAAGVLLNGVDRFMSVYTATKTQLDGPPRSIAWKLGIVPADKVTDIAIHGSTVYALTAKNAPRFRVVRFEIGQPFDHGVDVVPAGTRVVDAIAAASDALYVQTREDGRARITRVAYDNTRSEIALPVDGTISGLSADADRPGFLAGLESWTSPLRWYAYNPSTNELADAKLTSPTPLDMSGIVAEEVKVRASDGTMIPLSIVHQRGMPLEGTNPTILWAYGAYGIPLDAGYVPARMAFLDRGGVFAYAHVRGGGEYGEEWHLAGKDANKVTGISDFIDCAKWLVAKGYTSPAKLVARGGSAGAIVISGAFEREPHLFAAVVDDAPVADQLRMETSANGPSNVPEFGSVRTQQGFKNLYATSAVHHVVKGTAYPAVLITTGINDPRVDPWHAAKLAATLQDATTSDKPILLRVDYDAGHGLIGGTRAQAVALNTDTYSFVLWQTGDPAFQP